MVFGKLTPLPGTGANRAMALFLHRVLDLPGSLLEIERLEGFGWVGGWGRG
jgi:hypothetical protein